MADDDRRTKWDVLTGFGDGVVVTFPDRPSQAVVTLGNGWEISVTVSPGVRCSSGLAHLQATGMVPGDILGRYGSPEGWFDRAADAEVAIKQDNGRWYQCEMNPPWPPGKMQTWGYIDPDQLLELIARVDQQPGGCLCPACHP